MVQPKKKNTGNDSLHGQRQKKIVCLRKSFIPPTKIMVLIPYLLTTIIAFNSYTTTPTGWI